MGKLFHLQLENDDRINAVNVLRPPGRGLKAGEL